MKHPVNISTLPLLRIDEEKYLLGIAAATRPRKYCLELDILRDVRAS